MIVGRRPIGTVAYMGGVMCVPERFTWSWGQLLAYNSELWLGDRPNEYIHYARSTFSDHAPARNQLAASFHGEWLVQLDTDHSFDCDIVHRLVRLADEAAVDVVSALYQFRAPPHSPVAFHYDSQGSRPIATWSPDAKLLEIGATGAGCLFVRRSVFDRIAMECPDQPFTRFVGYSEDHSFFKRCHDLGVKTYIAPQIHSAHLRVHEITLDDYAVPVDVETQHEVGGFR